AQYQQYVDAMHTLVSAAPGSPEYQHAAEVAVPWVSKTVREHIAYRRLHPADDATTHFINAEVNGRKMTDDEIYSILELVISGGVGTTASLVTQSLVWLYQNPDERQRLIDDPSMVDIAVEEFLRVFSPTQALARTVMKDTEFHGCPLRKGDRALLSWASANRDATQFDNPDKVDITRWPNRHVAFGLGIHRCAGSHLGKAMAREMIRQVLARMRDYVVDMDHVVTYPEQGTNAGYHSIPVTRTPADRLLGDTARFCAALRRKKFPGRITVLSAENVPPYDRPPLSKAVLTGERDDSPLPFNAERLEVDLRLGTRALGLDPAARTVRTDSGDVRY